MSYGKDPILVNLDDNFVLRRESPLRFTKGQINLKTNPDNKVKRKDINENEGQQQTFFPSTTFWGKEYESDDLRIYTVPPLLLIITVSSSSHPRNLWFSLLFVDPLPEVVLSLSAGFQVRSHQLGTHVNTLTASALVFEATCGLLHI